MSKSNRILTGVVFNCLCCNRSLEGTEQTRTFPKSEELIALCNTCLHASKDHSYQYEFSHQTLTDAVDLSNMSYSEDE